MTGRQDTGDARVTQMQGLESPRPLSDRGRGPMVQVSPRTAAVVPTRLPNDAPVPALPGHFSFPGLAHRWPRCRVVEEGCWRHLPLTSAGASTDSLLLPARVNEVFTSFVTKAT